MKFLKAMPMWASGEEKTMNYHLVLRAEAQDTENTVLFLTAAYTYRLSVNGEFVAYGPARAAEGYSRVDEISLDAFAGKPAEIVIEVSGYNCRSYVCTIQDSFVTAELRKAGEVLLTTEDFEAYKNVNVVRETSRYAGQRHFTEVFDYTNTLFVDKNRVALAPSCTHIKYLDRHVAYPKYDIIEAKVRSYGSYELKTEHPKDDCAAIYHGKNNWGEFNVDEIKYSPFAFISGCEFTQEDKNDSILSEGEYVVFDLEKVYSGFLNFDIVALEESDVMIGFSELCENGTFEYLGCGMRSAIEIVLSKGEKKFSSFEPYTAKFVVLLVKSGKVDVKGFSIRSYEHSDDNVLKYRGNDKALECIYNAAIRSFCHNAVDIFTDCPSRERAGWLCDSYFSAKVEYELFGEHVVEDNFLENYTLFEKNDQLPAGVLPMCYPADVNFSEEGGFIPQWNLWYILEVCDYLTNRNKNADKSKFLPSVSGVLNFFAQYENSDGMLEDLPSWNFVEWSTANDWTWNVNYPTNFLYSEVLSQVAGTFGIEELAEKAEKIRAKTIEMSFGGEVFCDHAIRNEKGELENQPHVSEAAQYYAALFGGINIYDNKYSKLLKHIKEGFANFDKSDIVYVPVNAFVGFYLRMWFLVQLGEKVLLEKDIKEFFAENVIKTDTLWEHRYVGGSLDHGFSSYVVIAINSITNSL